MPLATMSDAVREYARNAGSERPDQAWVLSPYDTWERNPCYSGPPQPHPEEYVSEEEAEAILAECKAVDEEHAAWARHHATSRPEPLAPAAPTDLYDDDLPF